MVNTYNTINVHTLLFLYSELGYSRVQFTLEHWLVRINYLLFTTQQAAQTILLQKHGRCSYARHDQVKTLVVKQYTDCRISCVIISNNTALMTNLPHPSYCRRRGETDTKYTQCEGYAREVKESICDSIPIEPWVQAVQIEKPLYCG